MCTEVFNFQHESHAVAYWNMIGFPNWLWSQGVVLVLRLEVEEKNFPPSANQCANNLVSNSEHKSFCIVKVKQPSDVCKHIFELLDCVFLQNQNVNTHWHSHAKKQKSNMTFKNLIECWHCVLGSSTHKRTGVGWKGCSCWVWWTGWTSRLPRWPWGS